MARSNQGRNRPANAKAARGFERAQAILRGRAASSKDSGFRAAVTEAFTRLRPDRRARTDATPSRTSQ